VEFPVFSCDYNGWADVPEEEREGIDVFETAGLPNSHPSKAPNLEAMRLLPARSREAGLAELMIERRRAA
jgi:hypothetical protein